MFYCLQNILGGDAGAVLHPARLAAGGVVEREPVVGVVRGRHLALHHLSALHVAGQLGGARLGK